MKVINLTPHTLNIGDIEIKSSGIARVAEKTVLVDNITTEYGVIPIFKTQFGGVIDLPAPQDGVIYVVSGITAKAALAENPNRGDIYVPGKQVRDGEGRIIGCEGITLF